MMKRSFNADFINSVLMDESVREGAEIKGEDSYTAIVADPTNVLLENEYGGFVYVWVAPLTYEVHTQFLPDGRGPKVYHAAIDSLRYMFIHTDCMRVISRANVNNVGACRLADKALNYKGVTGEYNYYSLHYMDWVETDKRNKRQGELFHDLVKDSTDHGDDDVHDYHVGAALSIAKTGNASKAQQVYNYWAIASGYEQVIIDSLYPLILRIGTMKLLINNDIEVI